MRLKQIPEDFVVEEVFDLEKLHAEEEENRTYHYFVLKKTNYAQMRALERVAKAFNTSTKNVHFCGTKDKVGVTTQLISVMGVKEKNLDLNIEFLNERIKDLEIEFLGKGHKRVALGDHLANKFTIVVRDLGEEEIERSKEKVKEISVRGVLNLFDEQRFGYGNNSHEIGKEILKGESEKAVFLILTSLPDDPNPELREFVESIRKGWEEIKSGNSDAIGRMVSKAPRFCTNEVAILEHLKKHKNDFPGAFRTIHKKQRTIYLNAYQSHVFNEVLKRLPEKTLESMEELELVNLNSEFDGEVKQIVDSLLKEDKVKISDFELVSMPELRMDIISKRKVRVFPKELEMQEPEDDDFNPGKRKVVVSFELDKGAYATNVIKQMFL